MVTQYEYRTRPIAEWKKFLVKTEIDLQNGYVKIPAGTVCKIKDKHGGFTLTTEPCHTCGVSIFIRKVPPEEVSIVKKIKE